MAFRTVSTSSARPSGKTYLDKSTTSRSAHSTAQCYYQSSWVKVVGLTVDCCGRSRNPFWYRWKFSDRHDSEWFRSRWARQVSEAVNIYATIHVDPLYKRRGLRVGSCNQNKSRVWFGAAVAIPLNVLVTEYHAVDCQTRPTWKSCRGCDVQLKTHGAPNSQIHFLSDVFYVLKGRKMTLQGCVIGVCSRQWAWGNEVEMIRSDAADL